MTPVASARRRDHRVHATESSLPAAQPVQSSRAPGPTPGRRRRVVPWLIVSAAALAIVSVIAAGALSLGVRDNDAPTASGTEEFSSREAMNAQCAPRALSEDGERSDRCRAAIDRDNASQNAPAAPAIDAVDDEAVGSSEGTPVDPSAEPSAPGAPAAPAGPAPAPIAPAPIAPAPAVRPLAFAGISENHAIGLLGIRILSSYTLSLSGEPGSAASVSYGAAYAGSVTFGADGRASITLGDSLLSLGLSNPTIRVVYSDGTGGSEIQAPRDLI